MNDVKSASLAFNLSIIPGLGHIYLHRYLRGLVFQIIELIFIGITLYLILNGKDEPPLIYFTLIAFIVGRLYIAAEDTEIICKRIRNGWYGNEVEIDDSQDSDSSGGSYCVAPLLMGFIIALSSLTWSINENLLGGIPGILVGIAFFIVGVILARYEDRFIRY